MPRRVQMSAKLPACLLFLAAACAASTPDADRPIPRSRDESMPFIKLARREMALVLYFAGQEIRPGPQEDLERRIAQRLKNTYRTQVLTYRRSGSHVRFSPELLLELTEKNIDDAVIVEITREAELLHTQVFVLAMFDERVLVDQKFAVPEPESGALPAAKLADLVWVAVAKNFTDPGSAPALDVQKTADRLAEQSACKEALVLYSRVLKKQRPGSLAEARRYDDSLQKRGECKHKLAIAEELERDRTAVFSVSLEVVDLPPKFESAVRTVFSKHRLDPLLKKHTAKPVHVKVSPAAISMSVRFDAAYLNQGIDDRPQYIETARALYLDVYYTMMGALSQFREEIAESFEAQNEAEQIRDLPLTLRLTKPGGDSASLDFATLDDRTLLTDVIRMRLAGSSEIPVETVSKRLLRDGVFVLGSPNDADGALTAAGMVYKFFELTP